MLEKDVKNKCGVDWFCIVYLTAIIVYCCLMLYSCVTLFDQVTYSNLTSLKADVLTFVETFTQDTIETKKGNEIKLTFRKITEYEKGKGKNNDATFKQCEILFSMFNRHYKNRLEKGKWTTVYLTEVLKNIEEAFDEVIKTEMSKNKDWK